MPSRVKVQHKFKCANKVINLHIVRYYLRGEIQQIRNNINCDCKFIFLQQDFMIIRYYLVMKLYINDQYFPMKSFLLEKSANTISMVDVMTSSSHMVKLYYITREDN